MPTNNFGDLAIGATGVLTLVIALYFAKRSEKQLQEMERTKQAPSAEELLAREQAELDVKVSGLALENALVQIGTDDQQKKQDLGELLNKPTTIR
jgi:hypothetical protein